MTMFAFLISILAVFFIGIWLIDFISIFSKKIKSKRDKFCATVGNTFEIVTLTSKVTARYHNYHNSTTHVAKEEALNGIDNDIQDAYRLKEEMLKNNALGIQIEEVKARIIHLEKLKHMSKIELFK